VSAAGEPEVSVIVPSVSGTSAILECLAALGEQDGAPAAEVVIVDRAGEETREAIRRRFPSARLLAMPAHTPLPEMRGRGVAEARGRMIAVLGEHLRPAPSWLRAIAEAAREGRDAIGGPIESGRLAGAAEWAFYLSEYGPFIPPLGATAAPAGSNCAYRRTALDRVGALGGAPLWDADLVARLAVAGVAVTAVPGLRARSEKRTATRRLLAQRYHCSRTWGARRRAGWPWWRRLGFLIAAPLIAPVVLVRTMRTVLHKRAHRRELARALPLLAAVAVAWAAGEAMGVLCGPGPSPGLAE
jgi:GT2 family glycosyltransferase